MVWLYDGVKLTEPSGVDGRPRLIYNRETKGFRIRWPPKSLAAHHRPIFFHGSPTRIFEVASCDLIPSRHNSHEVLLGRGNWLTIANWVRQIRRIERRRRTGGAAS